MTAIYFFFGCCWLVFSLDDLIYNMNLNPHNWFYVVWCGFIDWFIDWLHELLKVFFCVLIGWSIGWVFGLIHDSVDGLIDSLTHWVCFVWIGLPLLIDWLIEIWNWNWNWNWLFDVTWLVDWLIDQLIVWLIVLLIGWCFDFDMRQTSIPISPCVLDQESAECMWEAIHKRHPCDFWSNLVSTKWNHKL